jgi:transketolase
MFDLKRCSHARQAYGKKLAEIGRTDPRIVVLDSDLSGSTKTDHFAREFPDRFYDIGIAEQNLMDIAAGFAYSGKIPFVSTFSIFGTGRGWEQIRNMIGLDHLHVNLVMTHAGFSLGGDGATHQSLEDIALMRVIPGMQVMVPADATEAAAMTGYAARVAGPKYIRLSRRRTVDLFDPDEYRYEHSACPVLEEGTDLAILACGTMVKESLAACYALRKRGISAAVFNVPTIKPLNSETIAGIARKTGAIITAEEHNVIGGLGSAVSEAVSESCPVPVIRIGVHDRYGESGSSDDLFEKYGLSSRFIEEAAERIVTRR